MQAIWNKSLNFSWTLILQCPRKNMHILNIFVEKINRAREVQFSLHEISTQKVLSPPFSISLHFGLSSLCCLHNKQPVFKCPGTNAWTQLCALDRTSIVHKTLTVPLSPCENCTLLALFHFSIKCVDPIYNCLMRDSGTFISKDMPT